MIIYLKDMCLFRDKSLTRVEIDAGLSNHFWRDAAKAYNDTSIEALDWNLCPNITMFDELIFTNSGFIMDEGIFRAKHNELKKIIDEALRDCRSSGNGDVGVVEDDCNDTPKGYDENDDISLDSFASENQNKEKGVSVEDSLKACSSEFFEFVQCNPVLFYCYTCMIRNDILESCSSTMPKDASGNSKGCNMTSYSHDKSSDNLNATNKKRTPLERACLMLTDHFDKTFAPEKVTTSTKIK